MNKMNLPNKLTILRILLVPVYAVLMYMSCETATAVSETGIIYIYTEFNFWLYVAGAVFVLASLTDLIDGRIARKYNMVTDFGKFLDPIADKILVLTAVIIFAGFGRIHSWTAIVIVAREIIIAALRNIAVLKNKVLAADIYGKLKTMFQLISVSLMHFDTHFSWLMTADTVLYYLSVALTVISGVNYIMKNLDVFKDIK